MPPYINTNWTHPELYPHNEHTNTPHLHAFTQDGYTISLHHGQDKRPLSLKPTMLAITDDGARCGTCNTDVSKAYQHAQAATDPIPTLGGQQLHPRALADLQATYEELLHQHTLLVGEHDALQHDRRGLVEQLAHARELAQEAREAESDAPEVLTVMLGKLRRLLWEYNHTPNGEALAAGVRDLLPELFANPWGLAGQWADHYTRGTVLVLGPEPDGEGEVRVMYINDDGQAVTTYTPAYELKNWRTEKGIAPF